MESAIGRTLIAEEVESLKDGSCIWVETDIPRRGVFLGIKQGKEITNLAGMGRFLVADVGELCICKEWLYEEPPEKERELKYYFLKQDSLVEDEEESIVVTKGTRVSSYYCIDKNNGLRVTVEEGHYKNREFIFSMVELKEEL